MTRRNLIVTAATAAVARPSFGLTRQETTALSGLWRSRSTAELLAFDDDLVRRYTAYNSALALVEEDPKRDFQQEIRAVRADGSDRLELEHWGTVTRFGYDRVQDWPAIPRFSTHTGWSSNTDLVVDAFFEVLTGHYAFAVERGIDWPSLRAQCDTALAREKVNPERLFNVLAGAMRRLQDGHGSLRGDGRYADSITTTPRVVRAWSAAVGKSPDEDAWSGLMKDGLAHIKHRILGGKGHSAARDNLIWGRLEGGLGYLALMSCSGLSKDGGGRADMAAIMASLDRALTGLVGAPGLIVDLRFNDGGWDRVGLALARHLTDKAVPAFTKQPVRSGVTLSPQLIEVTPAPGRRYTGPVAVLTSGITISAAEVALLGLRALPNTRSFGQTTYGALSDELYFRLPNGWRGQISNEIYRAADGQVYESVGIPPDQPTAEPLPETFWQTLDLSLDQAENWLKSN